MIENKGSNNSITVKDVEFHNSKITILGDNNFVTIEDGVKIRSSNIRLKGNNITLHISNNAELTGVIASAFLNSSITIGENSTLGNGELTIAEETTLSIGCDCMFAHGYDIRTSDMHPIYSLESGERVNLGKNIVIGDHVWLGRDVVILKGVTLADNIVVGIRSIVTQDLLEPNSIAVGIPAKIVNNGVVWGRKMFHKTMYDDPTLIRFISRGS